jgi:glycerophosphoryl diester phosphodiesterase
VLETHPFAGSLFRRSAVPLVVGHRGVPSLHQENSLAGFRRAVELGVPAVELDVHLTRDGRAVCVHDQQLERLTGTRANVRDLTWDQLRRLRIRRELPMGIDAKGAPVIARYEREEPISLLEEVLHEIAPRAAINVELKLDGERWWSTAVAEVTARTIAATRTASRVIVSSFDPRKLRAALRVCPELLVGFCFDDGMLKFAAPWMARWSAWSDRSRGGRAKSALTPGAMSTPAPPPSPRAPGSISHDRVVLTRMLEAHLVGRVFPSRVVAAEHTLLTEASAKRLHERGIALGTHTLFPLGSTTGKPIDPAAAEPAELARLVSVGVDWVETDDPLRVLELLAGGRGASTAATR